MNVRWLGVLVLVVMAGGAWADGPRDNVPEKVRRIPPPGIELSAKDRGELAEGVKALGKEIEALRTSLKGKPALRELIPDVQVYHRAVDVALTHNEFFKPAEVKTARELLAHGRERARQLRAGKAPWTTATGLVVRGYVSRIDGSVQPYGLVVPESYRPGSPHRHRLDVWYHGRGETLSEVNFIAGRERSRGQFTPAHAFVLHPYGRYCNANHFAGEVDTFEALDHVRRHYPIDEDRLVVRGFSMGGAACWHMAVHHAGMWAAAAPGAGFAETPEFLRVFQKEELHPTWYEKKLWHLYDCTDYAINLSQCPVVAYSGEIDRQKQAADIMADAMTKEGLTLVHIIGAGTAHAYLPRAKKEIDRRIDAIVARGRNPVPRRVRFTTWTLRYNKMLWVTVDGLDEHWERARVDAQIVNPTTVRVTTGNVDALTLSMPPGHCPLDNTQTPWVLLDGTELKAAPVLSDRSWQAHFRKVDGKWASVPSARDEVLRKRHGLQGPIDDAFMSRFLLVRPTGKPLNEKVGAWAAGELAHAVEHWRRQFRGKAPVKDDADVTDADIAASNLILWGDPQSNKVLSRIAARLPISWKAEGIRVGEKTYSADHHVPVLIFPNPLEPKRYVVVNSGFTYREYDYLNNARQVPKLPDFAVLDVNSPPTSQHPAKVVTAGFFDERWQLPGEGKGGGTGE
jgi:pimeloyl-ACP methyl ester carboxylesterase